MKSPSFIFALALLASGCVESHRAPPVVYYPTPPPPTSERPDARVYSNTPSAPPPNVAASDVALANSVSQLLKGDSKLAAATATVLVKVRDGIVSLEGSVPSEHARDEIVERVSQLPGAREVRDELIVER